MDKFDIIKSYLLDEGFAETEEAAIGMMVSMSESWKEEILEGYKEISFDKHQRMYDRYKKLSKAAMQDARDSGEASGDNRRKMGKMSAVIDKSSENLRKKQTKGELTGRGPRKEEVELDENRRAARSAGGYKDDSKKQTDPSKDGFTGISGSIADIMRQNKEIEAKNKKMKKEEVEVEEGYKEIDQAKKNRMFRRAGNLSRDAISTPIPPEKRQEAHKKSGKIIKQLNKLNQEEVVLEKKKDDTYLETDMKKRQANNEKARKDMEKMGTKMKNPHFEEVQQIDELAPLAAIPAVAGKALAVGAKLAAGAAKAGAGVAKGVAKGGLSMAKSAVSKPGLKLRMVGNAARKAGEGISNAAQSAADSTNDLKSSLAQSHELEGEQINEISAETALSASKARDKQAMMLRGPENTEKRAELRAKASQNYDRSVKKRKAGYVKNTASAQGPVRKMTAESISDIAALRAEMLNEEKE